ncbi:hypothetical protein OROHE_021229 [Orobanche hederae]
MLLVAGGSGLSGELEFRRPEREFRTRLLLGATFPANLHVFRRPWFQVYTSEGIGSMLEVRRSGDAFYRSRRPTSPATTGAGQPELVYIFRRTLSSNPNGRAERSRFLVDSCCRPVV